jgi:hypothetical protein
MSNIEGGSKVSGALMDKGGAEILVANGAEVWGIREAKGAHGAEIAVSPDIGKRIESSIPVGSSTGPFDKTGTWTLV